jgi:hypothetical protein
VGPASLKFMAIRINLLAEAQAAEELRRKNPVKRGIWVASFCVAVILLWILKLQLDIGFSKKTYREIEQSWTDNNTKYQAVTNNLVKIGSAEKKLAALDRLATNRFYWAPVLNALQQTMIDDIQVIKVTGDQKYAKEEPRVLGSGSTKVTVPGAMIEHTSLLIEAKDYDPNAQNYDKFKETLCNFDFFVKNLKRRDGFILDGTLSAPMADPSDPSKQFVVFRLTSHFPETSRSE